MRVTWWYSDASFRSSLGVLTRWTRLLARLLGG